MNTIMEMSKSDFKRIPHAKWNECLEGFNSLVIIPTDYAHDSGYMCMEFCAVDDHDMPIALLSGCSDVLNIDGIGGYGCNLLERKKIPSLIPVKGWSIDCLPCGYLRLFSNIHNGLKTGHALSNFEVFAEKFPQPIIKTDKEDAE